MSNFDWKELPNWLNEDEYGWLENASPQVWAWEFLRRNSQYRDDWKKLLSLKTELGSGWGSNNQSLVHVPPMIATETESQWIARILSQNQDPVKMRFDVYAAHRWQLQELFDPTKPYQHGVKFKKPTFGVVRIFDREGFESFLEDETLDDGTEIQRLKNDKAAFVFDLTRPLEPQCIEALEVLRPWKIKMLQAARIQKAEELLERRINGGGIYGCLMP